MTKQENDILNTRTILIDKVSSVNFNAGTSKGFNRYLFLNTCEVCGTIIIEPTNYKKRFGHSLDGMQILFDRKTKTFEVSEFQAGVDEDCLYIYTETKSFKKAIKSLLKGNYNCSPAFRIPKKIWD